jgi:hypothetical protein
VFGRKVTLSLFEHVTRQIGLSFCVAGRLSWFSFIKKLSCPATHHEGAWGERRYSSKSFSTSALDGGEWSVSRLGRALPSGKGPPVPIVQEAGWAPEPVCTQRLEEKSSASVGDRTPVVLSVVRHYTDWATAALFSFIPQAIWYNEMSYDHIQEEPSSKLGCLDPLVLFGVVGAYH